TNEDYDIIIFSAYIWNIDIIEKVSKAIKLISPSTQIFCGGPEVSYETKNFLLKNPQISLVIKNEGEHILLNIVKNMLNEKDIYNIKGLCFIDEDGTYNESEYNIYLDLDTLPFPYDNEDFDILKNKIIYYETSRGCPYLCSYCMSSLDKKVRKVSLDIVKEHLLIFLKKNVKQVKFVDRTFNFNPKRAMEIWQFLIDNDNGITNFHCEIAAILLDNESIKLLKNARDGLIQFEIGVQTTNEDVAKIINRPSDFEKICTVVNEINKYGNIHQHLDLIIGLPNENYLSFKKSFNDVYSLNPNQLQVGFLKLLKGSPLYNDSHIYKIISDPNPPYEILYNPYLSYSEVKFLKVFEDIIDKYHNSNRYTYTLRYLQQIFNSPFDFFEDLSKFYKYNGYNQSLSKENSYKVLFDYGVKNNMCFEKLSSCIRFDMLCFEKINKHINWLYPSLFDSNKELIKTLIDNKAKNLLPHLNDLDIKQLNKNIHIEVFDFSPLDNLNDTNKKVFLFDYSKKNILNKSIFYEILI
ncbi:MAG: DUF4080 domain-containing protein, partial [Oscillospiraceae bacterium]